MTINPENRTQNAVIIVALSFVVVLITFLVYHRFSIDGADESFLWYGMIHTTMGEVPIRDFHAYDPGRYYWGAMWFKLMGSDGPVQLRWAVATFEWVGLAFILLSLKRVFTSWPVLIFYGLLIHSWMYVHYKSFDIAVSVAAVYFALLLLEKPSPGRHFLTGIFVGFASFMGINHGLYTGVSFFLLIFFIWFKLSHEMLPKRLLCWGLGIIVGASPFFLMILLHPGFLESFLDRLVFLMEVGSNTHLPIPWPWSFYREGMETLEIFKGLSVGLYFLIYPVFLLFVLLYLAFRNSAQLSGQHVLIAATFVGLTYIHYAFDRADMIHLSLAISPLLIGLIALPTSFKFKSLVARRVLAVSVLAFISITSLFAVGNRTPWNKARVLWNISKGVSTNYVVETLRETPLWMSQNDAEIIQTAKQLNSQLIRKDEGVFVAPTPGLYAFMEKTSPTKRLYFLWAESERRQQEIIDQIESARTEWAIINPSYPVGGTDESRFLNAYPLVWSYIVENFENVDSIEFPAAAGYQIMRRRP